MTVSGSVSESPQARVLRAVHQEFATRVSAELSALLQAEIGISLDAVEFTFAGEFKRQLEAPQCLVTFELTPRPEWAVLAFDNRGVFGLLELLLGGTAGAGSENRALTEIEWSLLEEVVRTLVAPLGEAWKAFHAVEFKVKGLESDAGRLPVPEGALPTVRLRFEMRMGEQRGGFEIAAPQTFFDANAPVEIAVVETPAADAQRNFALLQEAEVDVEVVLDGPTMMFEALRALRTGQVVQFDFPLDRPLRAVVNGAASMPCHIVSNGRKRAFQVEPAI